VIGDLMFFCGEGGCHVQREDEHDEAARQHCKAMNRAHRDRTGDWAPMDLQVDWYVEGRAASERRATIEDSRAIDAAIALLQKHGFAVLSQEGRA
jgi:hypothetical protein